MYESAHFLTSFICDPAIVSEGTKIGGMGETSKCGIKPAYKINICSSETLCRQKCPLLKYGCQRRMDYISMYYDTITHINFISCFAEIKSLCMDGNSHILSVWGKMSLKMQLLHFSFSVFHGLACVLHSLWHSCSGRKGISSLRYKFSNLSEYFKRSLVIEDAIT